MTGVDFETRAADGCGIVDTGHHGAAARHKDRIAAHCHRAAIEIIDIVDTVEMIDEDHARLPLKATPQSALC